MPTRHIAFLRAINVGGRRVKMDQLRGIFTGMGLEGVETHIASGNVVFDFAGGGPAAVEAAIERELRRQLGFDVDTFLRSASDLRRIVDLEPFPSDELQVETNALYVTFLREPPPDQAIARVRALRSKVDDLVVIGRELFWLRRRALGDSTVDGPGLERALGVPGTNRNLNTLRTIVSKYC